MSQIRFNVFNVYVYVDNASPTAKILSLPFVLPPNISGVAVATEIGITDCGSLDGAAATDCLVEGFVTGEERFTTAGLPGW